MFSLFSGIQPFDVLPGIKYWIALEVPGETVSRKVSSRPYCKLLFARGRRASLSLFLRWSQMVLTRDDFYAKLRMSMWWNFSNKRGHNARVATFALNVKVVQNKRGWTAGVTMTLLYVVCCVLSRLTLLSLSCLTSTYTYRCTCTCRCYSFCSFIMKKRRLEHLLSMMSAFRSLWPSTMVSCHLLLVAVSSTFWTSSYTSLSEV